MENVTEYTAAPDASIAIATVRMTLDEMRDLSLNLESEGICCDSPMGADSFLIKTASTARRLADHTSFQWHYENIEKIAREAGATNEEATALTDILAEEGWGGHEFEDEWPGQVWQRLAWLRQCREEGTR